MKDATEERVEDPDPSAAELFERLVEFLRWWLGAWPPESAFDVASSPERSRPGWDGRIRPILGVTTPAGTVVSVPPEHLAEVRKAVRRDTFVLDAPEIVGEPHCRLVHGVFRWSEGPVDLPEAGEWVPPDDRRLPEWLRPFNGDVLVSFGEDGRFAAGVGLKRHSPLGIEIAVGTDPDHRGRGLARRLVAQATRQIISEGAVGLYLHAVSNFASAAVAAASGYPDAGWEFMELADDRPPSE